MPDDDPADTLARGMRALLDRRDHELAAGARLVGWKLGFTTRPIQEHFGLSDPVVGYLTDAGVTPDAATVPIGAWKAPALEVEVAVRVGPGGEVAGLAPALELVDLDRDVDGLEGVLACNVWNRGVVFGEEVPGVRWADVRAVVTKAGRVVAEGRQAEDPAATIAFVRSFLSAYGARLEPGHRVIAGSMIAPLPLAAGDEVEVTFGPLGRLAVTFVS